MEAQGQVRVGRCTYDRNGKRTDPSFPGFTPILCLTASSPYGELGPYVLKDKYGRIMENYWQGCKVYPKVPKSTQKYSRYDATVIWNHPAETHADLNQDGTWSLTPTYFVWRQKLQFNKYPVAVDKNVRKSCLFSLADNIRDNKIIIDNRPLDYVSARKEIYLKTYLELVEGEKKFLELKDRLDKGENLLIIEVDGPHEEDLNYYQYNYHIENDFISGNTMLANEKNLSILLNDTKHPFGHGYCLAIALLDLNVN